MAKMIFCIKDKEQMIDMVKNDVEKYNNIEQWLINLVKVINEYNYDIKQHNMWLNTNPAVCKNKNVENWYNAIAENIQQTCDSIYLKLASTAKFQIEAIYEVISDYASNKDEKIKKSMLRKLETRMNKMI